MLANTKKGEAFASPLPAVLNLVVDRTGLEPATSALCLTQQGFKQCGALPIELPAHCLYYSTLDR